MEKAAKERQNDIALSRRLIRTVRSGALASLGRQDGMPHTALVTTAADGRGRPIFLLSYLSDHTQNLSARPAASLLLADTEKKENPQAAPRISLNGNLEPVKGSEAQTLKARFLRYHPKASLYADFQDFAIWRMDVNRAHLVGGFARAVWLAGEDILSDAVHAQRIAAIEEEVLDHMNTAHLDAVAAMGRRWGAKHGRHWRMIGIDPEGCDLRLGKSVYRIAFDKPAATADDVRAALIRLAKRARS